MTPVTIMENVREVYQNRAKYQEAMARDHQQSGNLRVLEVIEEAMISDK